MKMSGRDLEICKLKEEGVSADDLAREYNLCRSRIYKIYNSYLEYKHEEETSPPLTELSLKRRCDIFCHMIVLTSLAKEGRHHGYPKLHMLKHSSSEQVQAFIFTKAVDWQYEQEWRIITTHIDNGGPGCRTFPKELLTEVIFGARVGKEDKEEVVSWLSERKTHVRLSQATLGAGSFILNIVPYEP